jgi:hypothetical protein
VLEHDRGLEVHQPSKGIQISHVQVAELAAGQITTVDAITIELVEADETPAVVIIRWRSKPPCSIRTASACCRHCGPHVCGAAARPAAIMR